MRNIVDKKNCAIIGAQFASCAYAREVDANLNFHLRGGGYKVNHTKHPDCRKTAGAERGERV